MKILFLILGILLTLASESYSYDYDESAKKSLKEELKEVRRFSELEKGNSNPKSPGKTPDWFWGNRESLSSSELLYLEADLKTPAEDWFWENGQALTPSESAGIIGKLTFPNWIEGKTTSISKPPETREKIPVKEKIFLTANHLTRDNNRNIIWAWGKVIVRLTDRTLQADRVRVNNRTGDGKAIGNVIITQRDGTRLKAQKSFFNVKNQQGRIIQTRGRFGKQHYIKGEKITRYSENHYKAQKGHLTTCRGNLPDWVFEAEDMDIVMGDRALFKKGVFKIKGVPILYFPAGYIPINQERKSGFLFPSWGNNSIQGLTFDNAYYWAIDDHSDATFGLDYTQKRGYRPWLQYRYTPSIKTSGYFLGSFIDDKITESTYWNIDAAHSQEFANEFNFSGILNLQSEEYNRNFTNNTNVRARRNSDSYATLTKNWDYSALTVLTRLRDSTDQTNDQTFGILPQIVYKVNRVPLGERKSLDEDVFYLNYDTSFTSYLTDLNTAPDIDDHFSVQRFDFHPQISYPMRLNSWLSFTPTVGVRETLYSKGLDTANNNERFDFFSRESFDIIARFEGPRIQKIFNTNNKYIPKIKHLLEPRITYSYIPDIDESDRAKIKVFDGIDSLGPQSQITYSLNQRLFQKEWQKDDSFSTRETLRFTTSQTLNLRELTSSKNSEDKRPFSDIRFDLDSRLHDNLEINLDSTFGFHENYFKTLNFKVGVKPMEALYLSFVRRWTKDQDTFNIATIDWVVDKGLRARYTSRFDESEGITRENNFSLLYDNPCKCWGLNFDYIERENLSSVAGERETVYLLSFTLRGLGSLSTGTKQKLIHREFESIYRN